MSRKESEQDRHFARESVKEWRRAVHKELRWLKTPSDDPMYRAAMVCAGVYCFGTDVAVLVEVTGQEKPLVRSVLKRMRKMRVLTGQTLRASGGWEGTEGAFGMMLDAMVAAGELTRPPDPKRSAAQKARTRATASKPRAPRAPKPSGMFMPKVQKSNPLYGLPEWEAKK